MGSYGHRVDFEAAHDWAFILNAIRSMGDVGTVFSRMLSAGDDTNCLPYKDVAQCALQVGGSSIEASKLLATARRG